MAGSSEHHETSWQGLLTPLLYALASQSLIKGKTPWQQSNKTNSVCVLIQSTESAALLKWKCQQLKTKNSKKCAGTVYTRCVQMSANSKTAGAAAKLISIACSRKNSSVTRNSGNQGFHLCQSSSLKRKKEMKSSCRKKEEPDVCF